MGSFNFNSSFSRNVIISLVWYGLVVVMFTLYLYAERKVDELNRTRLVSFQLADELRQSSEDLTRMVRSYVQTSDPIYKQHFQEILDIRNGVQARPQRYQDIYWDLVLADNKRPRSYTAQKIPLLQLMKQQGFTAEELTKLAEAKANSDALTKIEFEAMRIIESSLLVTDAQRLGAAMLLHNQIYHQAKASIMQPIDTFNQMMDQRTQAATMQASNAAFYMRCLFIVFGIVQFWLLWRTFSLLGRTLGSSVDTVHEQIARLGSGDIHRPIEVQPNMTGSVMHWLAETQTNLAKIDAEEKAAKKRNQRLTQLYAALSQCNQSIVRCNHEAELFAQICEVAVVYGGFRFAWIGLLNDYNQEVTPVASYGEDADYLDGILITADAHQAAGQGPTGIVLREDRPYWCQDYKQDPATLAWRARAAEYDWGASAALPLHRNGKVIGAFALYSSEVNAFDQDARKLLEEMAVDIDFALARFDIEHEREQYRKSLQQSEESARLVLENSLNAVINMDIDGHIIEWSGAAETIFGYRRDEAIGRLLGDLIVPAVHREAHAKGMKRLLSTGESKIIGKVVEIIALRRSGEEFPVELSVAQIRRGEELFFSAFISDVTERKTSEARIQYLANYDALTGLPNRNQLNERVKYAISLAQRSQQDMAIMFLDIDHFKDVNDSLGHSVGDHLLVELATRFSAVIREQDTVSRLGGDEFIFMLPNADAYAAGLVAQKLLQVIQRPIHIEHHHLSVTASIGIANYPNDGPDLEALLRNADVAMYKAKQENRNGYRFYTAKMQTQSARNLLLVNALRNAIQLNQMQVYYQPQINTQDNRVVGVEALLRWHHADLGMIAPSEFIPLAEASGLIVAIGEWVLRQSVKQAKQWLDAGYPPMIMAVNLSAIQFRDPEMPNLVSQILEEEGLPPEYLELELTEGVALEDPQGAITLMDALHALGIRMSIDDFGTGYSSLSHLKRFKVYKLKIDQSFVRDISTDEEDKAIVIAIIQLARSLGLKTIAEGVETAAQLAFLQKQLCDEVQGYLFSKPVLPKQLEAFLRKQ